MRNWRKFRLGGVHVFSWAVLLAGGVSAVLAQLNSEGQARTWFGWNSGYAEYGWPMLALIRTDELPGVFLGSIPRAQRAKNLWNWGGVLFNTIVLATLVACMTFVSEHLIRYWHKPWQFSLAGVLWLSSALAVILAMILEEYPPAIAAAFQYLNLVPRSERDIHLFIRAPIYAGIGCSFFVIANAALKLTTWAWQHRPKTGQRLTRPAS